MMAHFAIITFALVASFGVWHDSSTNATLAFGLSATAYVIQLLVVYAIGCRFTRNARAFLWSAAALIPPTQEGHGVSRFTLEYLRRANLIAGAPHALAFFTLCIHGGSTRIVWSNLHLFFQK